MHERHRVVRGTCPVAVGPIRLEQICWTAAGKVDGRLIRHAAMQHRTGLERGAKFWPPPSVMRIPGVYGPGVYCGITHQVQVRLSGPVDLDAPMRHHTQSPLGQGQITPDPRAQIAKHRRPIGGQ
jgi:hypothetical protein